MPLVLTDKEITGLVPMSEYVQAMEMAYLEYGNGIAAIRPRQRYQVAVGADRFHLTNIIAGAVPGCGLSAVRLSSWPRIRKDPNKTKVVTTVGGWGFIVLFDLESGKLLALLMDGIISDLRVGATTGVALKRLTRENVSSVGIFGSGWQARANLEAICTVRKISRVKVYSPNREHRTKFAREMGERLKIPVTPVDSNTACIQDVEIIGCFTSSDEPVFDGTSITPGQTVVSIRNTDHVSNSNEVDQNVFLKSDLIVVSDKSTVIDNKQGELLGLIDRGDITWEKVVELGDLVSGKVPGRTGDEQILYYKNNAGMGIQFAAAGKLVLEAAKKNKLGTEIPDELFQREK